MPCPNPTHQLLFPPPLAHNLLAGRPPAVVRWSILACLLARSLPKLQRSIAILEKGDLRLECSGGKLLKWRWRWRWRWKESLRYWKEGGKGGVNRPPHSFGFEVILLQGRSSSRHRGSRRSTVANQVRLQRLAVIHLVLHLGHLPPPQLTSNATTQEQQQQQQPYHSQHHSQHNLPCVGFLPRWR